MVTNAIYKWGNQQQVNLARASQKVNAEHREKLLSSVVGQTNYPIKLLETCYTLFSVLRLCLLECRDPLITSRNGDLHFPSASQPRQGPG